MERTARDSAVLHAILEAAVDAIVISDENGNIVETNEAASRMFQYTPGEMVGQSVNILMPNGVATQHDSFMLHYRRTGTRHILGTNRDVQGRRKDGTVFPVHLSVGETSGASQRMFIGIFHDLTQRKTAQEALARSQRLDAIGQMTGGIAHDFNNLLTVVIGNLELLQQRTTEDRQAALIQDALESAELGAELTSRLMIFARKSSLKPERTNLRTLCEETLALLRRTLGSRYVIKTDFADDLDPVMIDPVQLQSALVNLALNARDAMGERGELLISTANVVIDDSYIAQETDIEPGHYVRLSVIDNGAGMDAEAKKRAFEPFFTTKADTGGTGLGLAMVYGFVRQSGGHITLYSEDGLGTSFGLYFPALPETAAGRAAQGGSAASKAIAEGEVVLIVEDNPHVRKLSVERIRALGFATKEAPSGDEAYRMLKSGVHADILFSDLVMPGELNGYDLAAKVAAEFPRIKILLTSGYASDIVTNSMAEGQSYSVLHKPYRQAELSARLQALLAGAAPG
ncbi:PAS domain S-box protein [Roseobacter sinensis]|uniref:histidine kinase n=1 Tax=Roseobacter sinensis TaxID=2931391 RepID=A0ABT3BD50_9RHOB|nr:PAS domain S-box protein [Roseobacter sp. WL0113]MCV3271495.1 PAS domain S-box protein [Roseobacter sp. WL0113]